MFRGTCIGLSEYLVQIPQKKEAAKQLFGDLENPDKQIL